jgi:ubiquinone/menaquinone biosynthesis C-methylase UbiE
VLLNRCETLLMNNALRSLIQRRFEAPRLERMGGRTPGGHVLEVGCGRGVGAEIILDAFGAGHVDAFDLDPRMVALAERRLEHRRGRVRVRVGDVTAIEAADESYDAVFDFGIIHHVPDWQAALREIRRVLKPGGRLFAEEVHERFIQNPLWRRVLEHPQENRFDHARFARELEAQDFSVIATAEMWGWFGWYVAERRGRSSRRSSS